MQTRILVFAIVAAFAVSAHAGSGRDIDKVNGEIRLDAGETGGDLETVNGSIRLGDNARAEEVDTVNGSIDLGQSVEVKSLQTVNGAVEIGERSTVRGEVEAVNGAISVGRGATVDKDVSNVNGRIEVVSAHVGGRISTVQGDIDIGADSRVDGGILVERPSGLSWSRNRNPRVVIGPNTVIGGKLEFKRDVDLYVSKSAKIGTIEGATPVTFEGSKP